MPASRCTRAHLSRSPARRARKSSLLLPSGSPRPADERPPDYGCEGTRPPTSEEDALAALRLAEVGFVSQFHFLLPEFSALENVMLPMQRLGRLPQPEIAARDRVAGQPRSGRRSEKAAETAFGWAKPAGCHRPCAGQRSVADPSR